MKRRNLMLFFLVAALVSCTKSGPVVVLDSWWSVDYAKNLCSEANHWHRENAAIVAQVGCKNVVSCGEMMPIVNACALDSTVEVRAFENDLATEFASSAECSGVQFVKFKEPATNSKVANDAMQAPHYNLAIDYIPGSKKHSWKMISSPDYKSYTQGEGTPKEIAIQVCVIANEKGAKLMN